MGRNLKIESAEILSNDGERAVMAVVSGGRSLRLCFERSESLLRPLPTVEQFDDHFPIGPFELTSECEILEMDDREWDVLNRRN